MTGLLTRVGATSSTPGGRRPRLLVAAAAAVLIVVLLVYLVAFSPVLAARSVTVRGSLHRLSAADIKTAAQVPTGTPLIRLDTAAVRARVQALPAVASAVVSVSYPSGVSITVTERVAVGYLSAVGGFALVDKTGAQFVTTPTQPAGLPHFDLAPGADPRPSTVAAASVAAALPSSILTQLDSVSAGSPTAVELVLHDGRVVRWGRPCATRKRRNC